MSDEQAPVVMGIFDLLEHFNLLYSEQDKRISVVERHALVGDLCKREVTDAYRHLTERIALLEADRDAMEKKMNRLIEAHNAKPG